MISIICIYNNYEILNRCLISSLNMQKNCEYEVILVDSIKYNFTSAVQALNFGAQKAKGDYYVFVHQDIKFLTDDTLEKLELICKNNDFGIAGVAGVKKKDDGEVVSFSKIIHGKNSKNAAQITDFDSSIEVDSLDECLIIIPRNIFKERMFEEFYCTWHLFATEYCLAMKAYSKKILTIPLKMLHESEGASLNSNYFKAIYFLAKKYKKNTNEIVTLFGKWPTNLFLLKLKCTWRTIRITLWKR